MPDMGRRWSWLNPLAVTVAVALWSGDVAAACRLAILGDSLTAGYGVAAGEGFPARLADALEREEVACEIIDAGVSGDTTAGGLARLDWVLSDRPTHLLVELGGNDALRALPVEQMEANLDEIVSRSLAAGVPVMLAGMLAPPNLGDDYFKSFAAAFRGVADRHDVPLYTFFLDGVVGQSGFMQRDGIHPNADGVEEIVRRILPAVVAWLDPTGTSGNKG